MTANHTIFTRLIRPGQGEPDDAWLGSTVEERLAAVWTLTRLCYGWGQEEGDDEPRLQRSVVRVQRERR